MSQIPIEKIQSAYDRIRNFFPATPTMYSDYFSSKCGLKVFLKMENLNVAGSFKVRGATNAILEAGDAARDGVVATSAGNHAQGVAITARQQGIKATIFMPERAPIVKIESTRSMGAKVILTGETYDDAESAARVWQKDNGGLMIHPFADPHVIAGQGTVALELLEQIDNIDVIICPVGGGGLISGIASVMKVLKPEIRIYGVQTELFPTMTESFKAGYICAQPVNPEASLADGIAVKGIKELNFEIIKSHVDDMITVSESQIAGSIMELMERNHLLAEGAGASALSGLDSLSRELKQSSKKPLNVVCIVSGGNIDVSLLSRITTRGLIRNGRLMRLKIVIRDRPGAMVNLLNIMSKVGANLYNVEHNRMAKSGSIYSVEVLLELETINSTHQERIESVLTESGYIFSII